MIDLALYAAAARRMCEIVRADPLYAGSVWAAHLRPEGCNPGGIFQVTQLWWHWYAWSPQGARTGVADDAGQAVAEMTAVWEEWL